MAIKTFEELQRAAPSPWAKDFVETAYYWRAQPEPVKRRKSGLIEITTETAPPGDLLPTIPGTAGTAGAAGSAGSAGAAGAAGAAGTSVTISQVLAAIGLPRNQVAIGDGLGNPLKSNKYVTVAEDWTLALDRGLFLGFDDELKQGHIRGPQSGFQIKLQGSPYMTFGAGGLGDGFQGHGEHDGVTIWANTVFGEEGDGAASVTVWGGIYGKDLDPEKPVFARTSDKRLYSRRLEETDSPWTRGASVAAGTIMIGDPVAATGQDFGVLAMNTALAATPARSWMLGVSAEGGYPGEISGYVRRGPVEFDTQAFTGAAGSQLWLQPAGGLSTTKPSISNATRNVIAGTLLVKAELGKIYVDPVNFPFVHELSGVNAAAPTDKQVLMYDAPSNQWIASAIAGAGLEPTITPGTTAQYRRGDKTWQTLNTAAVPELTNLYYTDARARAALSASAPLSYNSSTGVISHLATDGNLHVPATSTTNNGRFLKAGATAGAISWAALVAGDIPALPAYVRRIGDTITGPIVGTTSASPGMIDIATTSTSGGSVAVKGVATVGTGVYGGATSAGGVGVLGSGAGSGSSGVSASGSGGANGLFAQATGGGKAGQFNGDVAITGGGLGITSTADAPISISHNLAGGFTHPLQAFNSGMVAGNQYNFDFGQSASTNNAGNFGFKYIGAGSSSNYVTLGMYGANDLLTITAAGVPKFSGLATAGFVRANASGQLSSFPLGSTSNWLRGDGAWTAITPAAIGAVPSGNVSGVFGQVAYFTGAAAVTGSPGMTFNGADLSLPSGSVKISTAASSILKADATGLIVQATSPDFPILNQSTTGNAATATKWATARTLTIGATGKTIDGTGDQSWSLAEIGAQAAGNYLPLSAGSGYPLSGRLWLADNVGSFVTGGRNSAGDPYFYVTATNATTAGIRLMTSNGGTGFVALSAEADGTIKLPILGAGFVRSAYGGALSSSALVAGDIPALPYLPVNNPRFTGILTGPVVDITGAGSGTVGAGPYVATRSGSSAGWLFQLGASNTWDLWNLISSTWTKQAAFSPGGNLVMNGVVTAGNAAMATWAPAAGYAWFGANNQNQSTSGASGFLQQNSSGHIYMCAPSGTQAEIQVNDATILSASSTGVTLSKALYFNDNAGAYIVGGRNGTGDPYFYVTSTGTPTAGIRLLTNNAGTGIVALSAAADGAITLASSLAWGGGGAIGSSANVVQGQNSTRTTTADWTTALPSGFYDNQSGTPTGGWCHAIIGRHTNEGNNYQSQIVTDFESDRMWFRRIHNGSVNAWRELWHTGNLSNLSQLINGPGYVTGGPYLALSGGTMNGGASITFQSGGGVSFPTNGACGIYAGNADNATYSGFNLKIKSWWGIGFESHDNITRTILDTRTGNFSTLGGISAAGGYFSSSVSFNSTISQAYNEWSYLANVDTSGILTVSGNLFQTSAFTNATFGGDASFSSLVSFGAADVSSGTIPGGISRVVLTSSGTSLLPTPSAGMILLVQRNNSAPANHYIKPASGHTVSYIDLSGTARVLTNSATNGLNVGANGGGLMLVGLTNTTWSLIGACPQAT